VVPRVGEMLNGDGKEERGSRTGFWTFSGERGGTSSTCFVVSGIDLRQGKQKFSEVLVSSSALGDALFLAAYWMGSMELASMDVWGEMRGTLRFWNKD
jgi:hypothetical protein